MNFEIEQVTRFATGDTVKITNPAKFFKHASLRNACTFIIKNERDVSEELSIYGMVFDSFNRGFFISELSRSKALLIEKKYEF